MAPTSDASLHDAAAEVFLRIFQSCESFNQLLSLMLTYRRMHSVWLEHHRAIIWHIAPKVILGFDRALMTARATALVHDAQRQGLLPPEIQPEQLTGERRKPDLTELHEILALHHLPRYIETKYRDMYLLDFACYHSEQFTADMAMQGPLPKPAGRTAAQEMEYLRIWRERFDTAAYTSLLLGAVFARAYDLPLLGNSTSSAWRWILELCHRADNRAWEADVEYLIQQFPAYDLLGTLADQDKLFGLVADWFIRSTLKELEDDAVDHTSAFRVWTQQSHHLFDLCPGSQTLP
ncbi:hypothetical protein C8A01DRAFT_42006 [Parachaetomium inaequale]|uniref:Uncharacterized protein n=1 Tax=Parachaetomium inaequale TaxID=2588326 RepID=A0AAN6P4F5_9PEZI|nr:hypothetical protein C8A01DRAFT_42006 [Parachaetomium inaequale]